MEDRLVSAAAEEARSVAPAASHVGYGTAGFRCDASLLDAVVLRMGMLAAVRGRGRAFPEGAAAVGVMITASHNAEPDNGLKMVDPSGGMMDQSLEALATRLANTEAGGVAEALRAVAGAGQGTDWERKSAPVVVVGRDTRRSSPRLHALLLRGVRAAGGEVLDLGVVPTPVVHWAVMRRNAGLPHSAADYYDAMCDAFRRCVPAGAPAPAPLLVDCANGVGSVSVREVASRLGGGALEMAALNAAGEGELNSGCGAEFVQKQRRLPAGVDAARHAGLKLASVDGDADRLVYFYTDAAGALSLLDGDKITALVCEYLLGLMRRALGDGLGGLSLGAVQTAYANGASTRHLAAMGVPVACVPTGVKHIHHKAEEYDVGVYFEANGHGTALFSRRALDAFRAAGNDAGRTLLAASEMVNQAIGDAVSDILLVEVALAARGGGLAAWSAMYQDLPSRMTKVRVADRSLVLTADAERRCVAPDGLQARVDARVAAFAGARSFVRPSGTEDVVRVYAEAATQEDADELARLVGLDVVELVGGPPE